MYTHTRSFASLFLLALFAFGAYAELASAAITTCPGRPDPTLNWSSSNVIASGCTLTRTYSDPSCFYSPSPDTTGSQIVTNGTSCTVSLSCGSVSASDELIYDSTKVWNGTACVTPTKPDLTAAAPTPSTATVGTQVTFTSTITNNGSVSTGSSFYNFFQFSTDGLTTIQDGANQLMTTLAAGASQNATWSPTPSAPGTFYIRACADKQDRNSAGTIDEANENNNCGEWTTVTISCPSGTAWNGTTCAAVVGPNATITVPSCTIATGASTCTSSVSWTSASLTTTLSVRQNGSQFSTSATSAGLTRTLQYGSGAANVFTAVHNGSTLDTKTGTASCASGSAWDGSTCAASAPPVSSFIDIFFN